MKKKDLTVIEFNKLRRQANAKPFSKFALFHQNFRGLKIFYKMKPIAVWEAYAICKDENVILNSRQGFQVNKK